MKFKSAPAALTKMSSDSAETDTGEFEAIVSVFNVVDYDNDVVKPGAFTKTIDRWRNGPDAMPVLWHHRADDPRFNIGTVVDMAEIGPGDERIPEWADPEAKANGGLWVKARIDTGDDASDVARHALRMLKTRRITQFSYGYEIPPGGASKGEDHQELHDIRCYEVSTAQLGANHYTELGVTAKAADASTPETGQAGAERKYWPRAALAAAECDLLVADLQHDEAEYWSL